MKSYRLGPSGRRLTLSLMVGAIVLWCLAVWLLPGTLGVDYTAPRATLRATLQNGLGLAHAIPAGVLLALIVSVPLLFWSLWQEWHTSYTLSDTGLAYHTAAGTLHFPWMAIRGLELKDGPEAVGALLVTPDLLGQFKNPFSRWLYRQAFGADRVPLYAGVDGRDDLVQQITRRLAGEQALGAVQAGRVA